MLKQEIDVNEESSTSEEQEFDVNEESSTSEEQDVNESDSSTDENLEQEQKVPYDRFKAINEEKKRLEQEIEEMKSKSKDSQEEQEQDSERPDPYDEPEEYDEWILKKFEEKQSAKSKQEQEAERFIDEQYSKIKEEAGKDIDEDAIGDFALENEIYDSKGRPNLVAAYRAMTAQNKNTSKERYESAPVADKSTSGEYGIHFDKSKLMSKDISTDDLVSLLSKKKH